MKSYSKNLTHALKDTAYEQDISPNQQITMQGKIKRVKKTNVRQKNKPQNKSYTPVKKKHKPVKIRQYKDFCYDDYDNSSCDDSPLFDDKNKNMNGDTELQSFESKSPFISYDKTEQNTKCTNTGNVLQSTESNRTFISHDKSEKDTKTNKDSQINFNEYDKKVKYILDRLENLKKTFLKDDDIRKLQEVNFGIRKITGKYIFKRQYETAENKLCDLEDIWNNQLSDMIRKKFCKIARKQNMLRLKDMLRNQWAEENKEKH